MGEFETAMQTLDFVSGLHNCRTGGNPRKIKLVRDRTQNTKLKLNNTKQKIKRANSRGAGEKSLHKPELVGQSMRNKSKLNKTKKNKRV